LPLFSFINKYINFFDKLKNYLLNLDLIKEDTVLNSILGKLDTLTHELPSVAEKINTIIKKNMVLAIEPVFKWFRRI